MVATPTDIPVHAFPSQEEALEFMLCDQLTKQYGLSRLLVRPESLTEPILVGRFWSGGPQRVGQKIY